MAPLLTPEEVAKILRTNVNTLKTWRYLNEGPDYIKAGARILYRESALEAWLQKQTETAA